MNPGALQVVPTFWMAPTLSSLAAIFRWASSALILCSITRFFATVCGREDQQTNVAGGGGVKGVPARALQAYPLPQVLHGAKNQICVDALASVELTLQRQHMRRLNTACAKERKKKREVQTAM